MTEPDPRTTDELPLEQLDERLELSAPATPEILELVHAMFEHLFAARPDIEDVPRMRFEMSVIEILSNIVEHAYRADSASTHGPGESRRFAITVALTPTRMLASLSDNGMPMSLDLEGAAMPDELAESGRGLAMAAAALDALDYSRDGGINHWHLLSRYGVRE
ncbi:hypothetical protein I601_3515 [Nocardioides dokdonensis FR1436]|uniref:Histidine kinase/HSP90-like ATPase domain-containing protein n=1 Tax=Nocardioides dokdonensis FR1436 TaxID=1300347 RepID=A0A1A9GR23_9ACTN|nr:ATP-binding protein [Nocardioides dokdonensis]ANH39921.1 hypothetical protein I601_3515 [Nocardioides dokdonensis FR1436]